MYAVAIRSIILYGATMVSIRCMGRRQIGELQPSEFAITILISNIATVAIENIDQPLSYGIIPMLIIVLIDILVSYIGLKNRWFRKWISGRPKIIVYNGKIDQTQLKRLRYTIDDLMESMRGQGIFNLEEIQYAIAETTGKISFYQKYPYRTTTNQDLNLNHGQSSINPPIVIVSDGKFIESTFNTLNLSKDWLYTLLDEKHLTIQDIFLMTADDLGNTNIVTKTI